MCSSLPKGNFNKEVQDYFFEMTEGNFKPTKVNNETTQEIIKISKKLIQKPGIDRSKLQGILKKVLRVVKKGKGSKSTELQELINKVYLPPNYPEDVIKHISRFLPEKEHGVVIQTTIVGSERVGSKMEDQILIDRIKDNLKILEAKSADKKAAMVKFLESGIPRDRLLRILEKINPLEEDNATLRWACEKGDIEIVRARLQNPNSDPAAGENEAIFNAAKEGHTDIAKLLLELKDKQGTRKVDPSDKDNRALTSAAKNGHREIVELLLSDKRVDPSAADNFLIKAAAREGWTNIVQTLVTAKKVDPSVSENYPIQMAIETGNTKMVRALLEDDRVDPFVNEADPLINAFIKGQKEIVKLALDSQKGDPALRIGFLAAQGNEKMVQEMLRGESDQRTKVIMINRACIGAAIGGQIEFFKTLFKNPMVDPSLEENGAIRLVAQAGQLAIAKLLLADKRVDPTAEKSDALSRAVAGHHTEMVKLLLSHPRIETEEALYTAASDGNIKMAKLLLADTRTIPSSHHYRIAIEKDHPNIAKLIFNHENFKPDEALREFIADEEVALVKLLLTHSKVNPSAHLARTARNGNVTIAKLLLADKRTTPSLSDFKEALEWNHAEIAELILKHGRFNPLELQKPSEDQILNLIKTIIMEPGSGKALKSLLNNKKLIPFLPSNKKIQKILDVMAFKVVENDSISLLKTFMKRRKE